MTTYHQVLGTAGPDDEIAEMALQLSDELRRLGPSEVFARSVQVGTDSSVRALQELPPGGPADVLIIHANLGDPEAASALLRRPERLVLAYHGIGSPKSSADTEAALTDGRAPEREVLGLLRQRVSIAIAASESDAGELVELGYTAVHVAHRGVRPGRLAGLPTHVATDVELDEAVNVPYVLGISDLHPHNCQHVLLHALHVLQSVHGTELGLVLVGPAADGPYAHALHQLTRSLRLRHVWFAGVRSGSSLATIHRRARVFGNASQQEYPDERHPLAAMSFGVPTVVRDSETTVGHGGLVLPRTSGPLMFAEAILMVDRDDRVRSSLIDSGLHRTSAYTAAPSARTVAEIIETAGLES